MVIRHLPARRKKPWELDLGNLDIDGKRKRVKLYFPTKGEAETEMGTRTKQIRQHGRASQSLSESDRIRFSAARDRLAAMGASIEQAVDFYARHHSHIAERVTVAQLVDRALEAKEKLKLTGRMKENSIVTLRVTWSSFRRGREVVPVSEVRDTDVRTWLESEGWAMRTQKNYLADLRNLFGWARRSKLASHDPCEGIIIEGQADESEVTCMTPEQAKKLVATVMKVAMDFLGYVALGLFAGIRSGELKRLKAGDIDLAQSLVVVSSAQSRTRSRRVVSLSKNAVALLRAWRKACPKQEQVLPPNLNERWRALRKAAGWVLPWPKNIMRHTAASMHHAQHGDEAALKTWLGHHASEDTLHRHYRATRMLDGRIVSPEVAKEFWGILCSPRG